jgi:hypothetical protein
MPNDAARTEPTQNSGALAGRSTAARGQPDPAQKRTFAPTVTEDGQLRAGGCALGRVEAGPNGEPILCVPDRYRRRCQARGTKDVPVNLEEAAEVARKFISGEGEPGTTKP